MNVEKRIILKLQSERRETDAGTIDIFAAGKASGESTAKIPEPETVELITEGIMKTAGGRVELSYDESELSGLDGSKTQLVFDTSEPDILTMIRSGNVRVTMVFSPGLRHICRYDNPILPFDLILMTHSLKNTIFEDGLLEIDYSTELAGVSRARTRLKISLKETEDGDIQEKIQ
jgi:uncharacterized beta-barrel protein YwiB (DUF1934 family)